MDRKAQVRAMQTTLNIIGYLCILLVQGIDIPRLNEPMAPSPAIVHKQLDKTVTTKRKNKHCTCHDEASDSDKFAPHQATSTTTKLTESQKETKHMIAADPRYLEYYPSDSTSVYSESDIPTLSNPKLNTKEPLHIPHYDISSDEMSSDDWLHDESSDDSDAWSDDDFQRSTTQYKDPIPNTPLPL
ncbi:hypothetical protein DSO57_1002185 [Entomophthora muscae]|uniref:Uncharacterized protein n=1 Tax=Entomophthora muscae TaxID=34485 RepID=A0ACC2T8I0_9FUNG|nr:hypothetical protein DSO57_1002185 [Entomophthora muscae]